MNNQTIVERFAEESHPDVLELFDRASLEELVAKHETPFMVLDLSEVEYQYMSLQAALPGVKLFYALKALSHPALIKRLKSLGSYFDLATIGEVELVESLGISSDRCLHSHPIKKDKEIKRSLAFGCNRFVVDNIEELKKFIPYAGQVELIMRVSFRSKQAVVDLSRKFGCSLEELPVMVELAQKHGIEVVGLSFHVGSQSLSPMTQANAIRASIAAIKVMNSVNWKFLDIGGSFPVSYQEEILPIEDFCAPLMEALSELPEGIEVFAEPGRFIAAPSMIEVVSIVGKATRGAKTWYYLDDPSGEFYSSVLAGPTCDSIDVVAEDIELPDMQIGDILIGKQMGAYTIASATEFNYYPKPLVVVVEDIFDPESAEFESTESD
jgi:ornithine decarboxylase